MTPYNIFQKISKQVFLGLLASVKSFLAFIGQNNQNWAKKKKGSCKSLCVYKWYQGKFCQVTPINKDSSLMSSSQVKHNMTSFHFCSYDFFDLSLSIGVTWPSKSKSDCCPSAVRQLGGPLCAAELTQPRKVDVSVTAEWESHAWPYIPMAYSSDTYYRWYVCL